MIEVLKGSCLCGSIKYTVDFPPPEQSTAPHFPFVAEENGTRKYAGFHCHCNLCRRSSGALFQSFFSAPEFAFHYDPSNSVKPTFYTSSDHGRRGFCPTCGSSLLYISDSQLPGIIVIGLGCLDRQDAVRAVRMGMHIFAGEVVEGDGFDVMKLDDGRAKFPQLPENVPGQPTN